MNDMRRKTRMLLWQWGSTRERIERLERERISAKAWADDALETLKGMSYDGVGGSSGIKHDLSDVIAAAEKRSAQYADLVERIDKEISDAIRLRNTIQEIVIDLTPLQERVLGYRYLDGHGWAYIAMKMQYDERWVRRIEGEAVDIIAEKISIS